MRARCEDLQGVWWASGWERDVRKSAERARSRSDEGRTHLVGVVSAGVSTSLEQWKGGSISSLFEAFRRTNSPREACPALSRSSAAPLHPRPTALSEWSVKIKAPRTVSLQCILAIEIGQTDHDVRVEVGLAQTEYGQQLGTRHRMQSVQRAVQPHEVRVVAEVEHRIVRRDKALLCPRHGMRRGEEVGRVGGLEGFPSGCDVVEVVVEVVRPCGIERGGVDDLVDRDVVQGRVGCGKRRAGQDVNLVTRCEPSDLRGHAAPQFENARSPSSSEKSASKDGLGSDPGGG
jgi:hypothetical protein